ncbi:MAG: acetate kinase [Chloroflexota bacterium]
MYILVINSGSSSIKFGLYDAANQYSTASGDVSRIGEKGSYLKYSGGGEVYRKDVDALSHAKALECIMEALLDGKNGALKSLEEIDAVGHRVVHGGSTIRQSVVVDEEVINKIRECIPFAPLHNPPNLEAILECRRLLPGIPQVAVLDTSFHQTMPPQAYMYAIPYDLYEKYGARRYGFHGSSYRYVSLRAAEMMGRRPQDLRMVVCHLGNGSSMAAIRRGRSVDTTMGMTPVEGLMMGTRSGDIDAGLVLRLIAGKPGLSVKEVDRILNNESGILGISGLSKDMRDVQARAVAGDLRCMLALDMYAYRIRKYVGAYAAAMGGIDLLVFTGGIGENSAEVRGSVCDELGFLGIEIDSMINSATQGVERDISTPEARVRVLVVPTNEEKIIVQDTLMLTRTLRVMAEAVA